MAEGKVSVIELSSQMCFLHWLVMTQWLNFRDDAKAVTDFTSHTVRYEHLVKSLQYRTPSVRNSAVLLSGEGKQGRPLYLAYK